MIVGIGNLGRALISYFAGRRPQLTLVAAFDRDRKKVNRVLHGTRCYPDKRIAEIVKSGDISIAIIAVPASEAQAVAKKCVKAGIKGILNFAPVPLHVPASIYVLDTDITMAIEKVAFFARKRRRDNKK
jgi:redox-sensing transcriptional repressor